MANVGIEKELLISELLEAWERKPYLRLGQLLVNIIAPKEPCAEVFYIEDKQLYDKTKQY